MLNLSMICHGNGFLGLLFCFAAQDYHVLGPLPTFFSTPVSGNYSLMDYKNKEEKQ